MKNKTMKNLIAFFSFAVLILGAKSVSAGQLGFYYGGNSYNNSSYIDTSYYNPYGNTYYQEPYSYVESQPKVQYVYVPQTQAQPQTQIKYVPVETVKYVNTGSTVNSGATSNQAASVIGTTNNTATKKIVTKATTNTGSNANTGQYISYDQNGQMMLASAYNAYNAQPAQVVDGNGVTALTVAGSGSFMPSSVFQWFLVILLILGIIIVARMISKSFSKSHAPVSH